MNILLTNHFPLEGSGSGIYTLNIAEMLTQKGFDVTVITPDVSEVDKSKYDFEVRNIIFKKDEDQKVYDLDFNFPCFTTHPLSTNTFYELSPGQLDAYITAFRDLIKKTIKEKNIQIFHGQHLWLLSYIGFDEGLKGIVTCHGTDLMGYQKDPSFRKYVDDIVQRAEFIIAVSDETRGQIIDLLSVDQDKVVKILNGFDPDIFKPQEVSKKDTFERLGIPETDYLISFTGKLAHFKGVDVLLNAAKIYEERVNVTTLIMGDGELKGELIRQREKLKLKNVHFLGHKSQVDMAAITAAADVAVTPSRKEPFGLVAIEALACETPVVVSDDGGLKEFIDEKVGQVFRSEDSEDLADKLLIEIQSNAKEKKGAYAASYALKNFSWYSVLDKVIDLYQKVG
jgi:glycosyltransferase involved in cell wall biosynthesis